MDDVFIEWRNKILALLTTSIALTFAAARYLKTHDSTETWVAGAVGALLSLALLVMDGRNNQVISHARKIASNLETHMGVPGAYSSFPERRGPFELLSYTWMIRLLGLGYLCGSLYLAVAWTT